MMCSLAPIWCAMSAQGVLVSKSSMANVLDVHSRVFSVDYHITSSTSDLAHWCVEYNDVMCYMHVTSKTLTVLKLYAVC